MSNLDNFHQPNNSSPFDSIRHVDDQAKEYWLAKELMGLLGYKKWERFVDAIDRAKIGCQNTGVSVENHFADAGLYTRDVPSDYRLSRYACYLVAMNGDPRKSEIAAAQSYFAVKTREAELAPQSSELLAQFLEKLQQQNTVIEEQGKAISVLQSQIQNLLPQRADFIPPGWDAEVWHKLPQQDKRHFRFLFRRRRFRPSQQGQDEPLALPAVTTEQMKQRQRAEVERLIGQVPPQEQQRLEAAKREALQQLLSQGEEDDEPNVPF